ncbi:MAG: hypothetical protein U1E65_00815 [Myxococcota bacterium]
MAARASRPWLLLLGIAGVACSAPAPGGPVPGMEVMDPCAAPTGPGTMHQGFITSDEIWTAATSPHRVTAALDVRDGATLTLEACAIVEVASEVSITIGQSGAAPTSRLVAEGKTNASGDSMPVVIRSVSDTAHWGALRVVEHGFLDANLLALVRGGGSSSGAALYAQGDDNRLAPVPMVRANGLVIANSLTLGFRIEASAGFTEDSSELIVQGAGSGGGVTEGIDTRYAGYVELPAVHTLPRSSSYTGNAIDAIWVHAGFTVAADETFREVGVPYQVRAGLKLAPSAGSTASLTIEPGVTIRFSHEGYASGVLELGDGAQGTNQAQVRLSAAGTAERPIRFTSGMKTPAPGDWLGVIWVAGPATGNSVKNAIFEYGGKHAGLNGYGCGPGTVDALLVLRDWRPEEAFLDGCSFRSSAGGGVVSGWSSDAMTPDLKSPNTFEQIANGCDVSQPKHEDGTCPGNDQVPDCF